MTEIQPHNTASQDEYPYWVPDGMDQGDPSIYDNVMTWLRSPRRWKDRNLKRYKNIRISSRKFRHTLGGFTPDDLRDDQRYSEFIESLQQEIESSDLAQTTLDGYLGYLTGKVLTYGEVNPRIVEEVKTQVTIIKKGMRKRKATHRGIEDEEIANHAHAAASTGSKKREKRGSAQGQTAKHFRKCELTQQTGQLI